MGHLPTLDLFVLSFNCGKALVNTPVLAAHLRTALQPTATGRGIHELNELPNGGTALPDVVVFSLQEIAPIAYAFIGSYFLHPYYARFEEALNLAVSQILADEADDENTSEPASPTSPNGDSPTSTLLNSPRAALQSPATLWGTLRGNKRRRPPYQLVRADNVGMTAILLFARTSEAIQDLQKAEVAFGAADMGNKGAIALRFTYADPNAAAAVAAMDQKPASTELTFVATHLAAMEWNLRRRNANWRTIVSGLAFENPKSILPKEHHIDEPGSKAVVEASAQDDDIASQVSETEHEQLLARHRNAEAMDEDLTAAMQRISVYKPESYLFVAGDLNYRISTATPPALAKFPNLDQSSDDFFPEYLPRDQLTQERKAGRTLHGLTEAEIEFPPTYKIVHLEGVDGAVNGAQIKRRLTEDLAASSPSSSKPANSITAPPAPDPSELYVPWKWASHRWPGWCDRILYLDVPAWARKAAGGAGVQVAAYRSLPVMRTSDHRPVYLRARVPMIPAEEMRPSAEDVASAAAAAAASVDSVAGDEGDSGDGLLPTPMPDPRLRLPVPIDTGAWERRAVARRRELGVGWSMMLFSTYQGAVAVAVIVAMGVGGWWVLGSQA